MKLTLACDDYDLVQPLFDGRLIVGTVEVVPAPAMPIAQRQRRMVDELAFDLCELGVTTYFMAVERGLPFRALPIFLLRKFRHGDIFVRAGGELKAPADFIGKRVVTISYQVPASVWARGILAHYYGVAHDSVTWVVEREEEIAFNVPPGLRIERLQRGLALQDALLSGVIDALIAPIPPPALEFGVGRVARLFPDYKKQETAYFHETGIFPIMHVLTIRQSLLDKHSSIARDLCQAFEQAKLLAYQRASRRRAAPLAWFGSAWEEERLTLGPDPWAYGLGPSNVANLETLIDYMREQGLLRSRTGVSDLFVE